MLHKIKKENNSKGSMHELNVLLITKIENKKKRQKTNSDNK